MKNEQYEILALQFNELIGKEVFVKHVINFFDSNNVIDSNVSSGYFQILVKNIALEDIDVEKDEIKKLIRSNMDTETGLLNGNKKIAFKYDENNTTIKYVDGTITIETKHIKSIESIEIKYND